VVVGVELVKQEGTLKRHRLDLVLAVMVLYLQYLVRLLPMLEAEVVVLMERWVVMEDQAAVVMAQEVKILILLLLQLLTQAVAEVAVDLMDLHIQMAHLAAAVLSLSNT
jgi:hypothetical protein